MAYKPKHPALKQEHNNTIKHHIEVLEHLNELPQERRDSILAYVEESIPMLATKDDTAIWCHIQHALKDIGVLGHTVNVYVMYHLEINQEEIKKPGFLEELYEQFK